MTNFNTQDYDFLLKTLNQGSLIFKSQSLKRLLMLATNDKKQFLPLSKQVLQQVQQLYVQDREDINLNATLIVTEIVSNMSTKENQVALLGSHFQAIIRNLGHATKPNVRKASHTCLLAYLKSYKSFGSLVDSYVQYGFNHESPLVRQKAINSFQSIFILELKRFDWKADTSSLLFDTLLNKIEEQNQFVLKAAAQCLITLSKISQIHTLVKKLSSQSLERYKLFLEQTIQNIGPDSLKIIPQDIQDLLQIKARPVKVPQRQYQTIEPQVKKIMPSRPPSRNYQTIKVATSNNTQRRLDKIRNSIKNQNKKVSMIQKQSTQSKLFGNILLQGSLKQKSDAAQQLLFKIQSCKQKPDFQSSIKQLLPSLIKMLKDNNPKIVSTTLKILELTIEDLNPNDKSFNPMISTIVQKLGDPKISIRQSVSKVIKELISKTKKGVWIHQLIQNMKKNTNTFLRDQTLALILYIFEQNSKQQIDYDFDRLLDNVVIYSDDPKTKIKIRTLDCLAQIVFVSDQVQKYNQSLKGRMPSVFYQMYMQKVNKLLKQKKQNQKHQQKHQQKVKEEFSSTSRTGYHQSYHKRKESQGDTGRQVNLSMQIVKRRVSLLKKPRHLMSTQQTASVDNKSQRTIDRTLDQTIQDVQVVLPSVYKKTGTSFITNRRGNPFSPNKTIQHNNKSTSDYLSKEDLTPLRQPEKQFKTILNALKSSDWKVLFQTTNQLRRLIQFNPQVVTEAGQQIIHGLVIQILAMVQNLRSSIAKNALICLNQLILTLDKQIDYQMQAIFDKVIKKAADTNVFISFQVQKSLNSLSVSATPTKILDKITQFKDNKSIPIKQACVNCLLSMKQQPKLKQKQYIKLIQSLSVFIFDSNLQVRTKSKTGISQLCQGLGDWYRALRGKINAGYFKSICQIMTKAPAPSKQPIETLSPVRLRKSISSYRQENNTIKSQSIAIETPVKIQKMEIQKKKLIKISNFPSQFQLIQGYLEQCSSSDWKKRIESLNNLKQLALQHENQFVQYRSANHFIDVLCKQIMQSNIKVSINSMNVLQQIYVPLKPLIQNNLSLVCNSLFFSLSSSKSQPRQLAQTLTYLLLQSTQPSLLMQHLTHGILYSLPKSRVFLLQRLRDKLEYFYENKKQLLLKFIFPVMNKLMDEYKSQIVPTMIMVFTKLLELMGNQMYNHINKFKQVKDLIQK